MPETAAPTDAHDVFISYAREDRPTAARLAAALQQRGLTVWWDRELLGGAEFADVIERELNRARVAIVLWSNEAVRSSFVRDECARAHVAGKLLPARIEDVAPPLGFGQLHTLDLIDWDGEGDAAAFTELVAHIERHLKGDVGPLPAVVPGAGMGRITRRIWLTGGAVVAAVGAASVGWWLWVAPDTVRAEQLTADGVDNFEKKEFGQARLRFNQALQADRDYAPALFYRAQVLVQSGAPEEASADLRRVLDLRRGLDDAQLRDARRWLADLVTPASEPAAVTRVASADAAPTPPATPPRPAPAASPATPAPAARPPAPPPPLPDLGGVLGAIIARPSVAPTGELPVPAGPKALPLEGVALDKLSASVEQMFSPTKDVRLAATTSLIVDPELMSDAVPLGVRRALQAQRDGPPKDSAELSGVINVLVLLQSAMPSTLTLHAADITRLLDAAKDNGPQTMAQAKQVASALADAGTQTPVVFIQIASEAQRALGNVLAARLRAAGYRVPAAEVVGARAPQRTEIRVQGRSDRSLARWMAKIGQDLAASPVTLLTLRNVKPKKDTFEVWFDAGLCVAPDRKPAACTG